jgi:hypothetical protein
VTVRVVPLSVIHLAGDLDSSAVWNAGPVASTAFLTTVPIFSGSGPVAFSVNNSVTTPIPLTVTGVDSDSGHSNLTNNTRYTAQVSGWYMVSGTISWNTNTTGNRLSYLAKNGRILYGSTVMVPATTAFTVVPTGTVLILLNASDYVELWGYQSSGGALTTATGITSQGTFLHAWWVAHA